MSLEVLAVLVTYAGVLAMVLLLFRALGRGERLLTPIAFFGAIEVLAVWPSLVPTAASGLAPVGAFPASLAAVGLLGSVVAYIACGGSRANAAAWRGDLRVPTPENLHSIYIGLTILVSSLMIIGVYRFDGIPPLLTGGLSSLVDPVGQADQVAQIRETRLSLTKGHQLLGEEYSGQGLINALTEVGWTVAVIVSVLCWTWSRSKGSLQQLLWVCLAAFVFLGSAGARSPIAICLVGAIGAIAIRFCPRPRAVVLSAGFALALLLFIMPLAKGANAGVSASERASEMVSRITTGNGQNNAQIVRLVSSGSLEIEHGSLFVENLQEMIPGPSDGEPFGLRLTRLAYGGSSQTTAYATPTQYGLMYADGGAPGVMIGYLLSGAVLGLAWRGVTRIEAPLGAAAAVEGAILLGYTSVTGIHGLLASAPIAALLLLLVAGPQGWAVAARNILGHRPKTRQGV